MRKLFALLFVAGTIAFASCQGEQKTEEAATDTTTVETPAVAPADTAAAPADTAAAPAADSAAAPAAH